MATLRSERRRLSAIEKLIVEKRRPAADPFAALSSERREFAQQWKARHSDEPGSLYDAMINNDWTPYEWITPPIKLTTKTELAEVYRRMIGG